ncbi:hypothetical protein, partial [Aeromonas veronii]|uniref:hypothetical protein n=1 Tax=Aeromonas veronii TaxID=654 RepID=UPI00406CC170
AKTEAADLAAAGETLEAERDTLAEQLAALTSERDVLAGKAAEQLAELGVRLISVQKVTVRIASNGAGVTA